MKRVLKNLFIYFVSVAIIAQSLSSFMVLGVSAKKATDSAELVTPTTTPSLIPTPTVTPILENNLIATPTPELTVTPTPIQAETLTPTPTPSVQTQESVQSASLTSPIFDNYIFLEPNVAYNLPAGQKALIIGDVIIDGIAYFDSNDNTAAVDVLIDGNPHSIFPKWGATIDLFTSDADSAYINQKYTEIINSIIDSGKTVDRSSLNQLAPAEETYYFTPSFPAGGTYSVPLGQRVIITADVKIDGIERYDKSDTTVGVNVLVDEKTHVVEFPYGGQVRVFSNTATTQFIQQTYNSIVNPIIESGKTIDIKSLNQLVTTPTYFTTVDIEPGGTYQIQQGFKTIIYGDVAISNVDNSPDILDFFDDNGETVGLHIITDAKEHIVHSPWGATLIMFNVNATNQFVESEYIDAKNNLINSGKKIDPTSLNQLIPPPQKEYPMIFLPGQTYSVPAGQRVLIVGDVTIDGIRYFDSDSNTIAVDVLVDGRTHSVTFPYGATMKVYTEAATTQYIVNSFINVLYQIDDLGKGLDENSLIEL